MTPISPDGTSGRRVEPTSGAAFQNVRMPACEGDGVLSRGLHHARGQRAPSSARPHPPSATCQPGRLST